MPSRLSEVLSGATAVLFDNDRQPAQDAACAVRTLRQLAPFQEAQKQHRLQPLRPLLHRLRCAAGLRDTCGAECEPAIAAACRTAGRIGHLIHPWNAFIVAARHPPPNSTPHPPHTPATGGASRPLSWR